MRDLLKLLPLLAVSFFLLTCQHSTDAIFLNLPPTSHTFDWTFHTLGSNAYNTEFSDVTIVNDTLVYVSGELYLDDSTGQLDQNHYNLARWNGRDWAFRRIRFYTICGQPDRHASSTQSVSSTDQNHIYLLGGAGQVATFADGDSAEFRCLPNTAAIEHLWAAKPTSIYAAGLFGNVLHFDGAGWQLQSSGTGLNLKDVCARWDGRFVFASGRSISEGSSVLLVSDGQSWRTLWQKTSEVPVPPLGYLANTIWAGPVHLFVGTESAIYRCSQSSIQDAERVASTGTWVNRIRGSAENNIAAACDDGSVWHFNGEDWLKVVPSDPTWSKPLTSIAVSSNMIVAVGYDASAFWWKGRVVIGRRK